MERSQQVDIRLAPATAQRVDIRLSKEDMKFSSAHFACYHGHRERLHGHNYRVAVHLSGTTIGPDGYLLDFGAVKSVARRICKSLDEYMLVPLRSEAHTINRSNPRQVEVTCEDGSFFSFPVGDCRLLPLAHTSVEELAGYVWEQLVSGVDFNSAGVQWVEVQITETAGQSASFGNRPKL